MAETEDTYHEMMVHPAMMMHENPIRVCCIGGGDGGCLKELLKYREIEKVVVVEIDSLVFEAVNEFFPVYAEGFKDPRVELVIDDGYQYLKDKAKSFDIILVDSYDPGGPVQSLETEDFHYIVSQTLAKEGIAVFQTDSPLIHCERLRSTIQKVSPFFSFYRPYICSIRSFPEGIYSFLVTARLKENLERFDHQRYNKIGHLCNYYNSEIHTGAFLLPNYLKKAVTS
jgi:spermidine synthase